MVIQPMMDPMRVQALLINQARRCLKIRKISSQALDVLKQIYVKRKSIRGIRLMTMQLILRPAHFQIHLRSIMLVNPYGHQIDQHNAVSGHNLALMQNGGRPSGALIIKNHVLTPNPTSRVT